MFDSSVLAAFIGAAAAFVFMRLTTWLDKLYERKFKHFLAILEVDHACTELVVQIQQTQIALKAFRSAKTKIENKKNVPLVISRPTPMTFPVPNKSFLSNQNFLTGVYRHEKLVEAIDMDIKSFTEIHTQGQRATLENPDLMSQQEFITKVCCDAFDKLEPALDDLFQRNIKLLAQARVLLKHHRPIALCIMKWLSAKRLPVNYKNLVASEAEAIQKEFLESRQDDAKRISETIK